MYMMQETIQIELRDKRYRDKTAHDALWSEKLKDESS